MSVLFPVYTAQAPGCSMWSGPCVECGSSFRVLHKSADSVAPAFCVFPSLSGSGSQRLAHALPGAARLFPPRRAAQAARGLAPYPQMRRTFSLRGPSAGRRSGLRKSLDRTRGLFAGWEGVASLGLSLPLAPPPASFLQRGWPALLWSFSVPLFCEPPAVCSGWLIFPCSPTV